MRKFTGILLLLAALSCVADKRDKPSSVPEEAIWKGGRDGGCWILFNSITETSIDATIFYEHGEVWGKGIFRKVGNCSISKENIVKKIVAFDGEKLVTNEGCFYKK